MAMRFSSKQPPAQHAVEQVRDGVDVGRALRAVERPEAVLGGGVEDREARARGRGAHAEPIGAVAVPAGHHDDDQRRRTGPGAGRHAQQASVEVAAARRRAGRRGGWVGRGAPVARAHRSRRRRGPPPRRSRVGEAHAQPRTAALVGALDVELGGQPADDREPEPQARALAGSGASRSRSRARPPRAGRARRRRPPAPARCSRRGRRAERRW